MLSVYIILYKARTSAGVAISFATPTYYFAWILACSHGLHTASRLHAGHRRK